ncbi:MAG TPA: outer membrane beta-barrel protein, partial [Chitinophagaceae bacterium]
YDLNGFEENPGLVVNNRYHFFNPKAGISYHHNGWSNYFSIGAGSKEPNRDDFEAGKQQQPKAERLYDLETGIGNKQKNYSWNAVLFYMRYKDQLVLTGKINDVGAYTRTNIPESYRAGIELEGTAMPVQWFTAAANLALSRSRVINFVEYIDDYDNGGQKTNGYHSTDIALSPSVVSSATLAVRPFRSAEVSLTGKYVGRQFLDNTGHESRSLEPYYVQDLRGSYDFAIKRLRVTVALQVNNLFNEKYEPNGYTYNYISNGALVVNNYYFPMAGTNLLFAVNLKF